MLPGLFPPWGDTPLPCGHPLSIRTEPYCAATVETRGASGEPVDGAPHSRLDDRIWRPPGEECRGFAGRHIAAGRRRAATTGPFRRAVAPAGTDRRVGRPVRAPGLPGDHRFGG